MGKRVLLIVAALAALASQARAEPEIVIAIRYLQAKGTSHSHLFLYREDGKLLRQLTKDNTGQDVDPIFARDGKTIVFTREKPNDVREFWTVDPCGGDAKKLNAAPDWYTATMRSPYFTSGDDEGTLEQPALPSPAASSETSPSPKATSDKSFKSPDGSIEIVLHTDDKDPEDRYDDKGHGKHYLLRDLKAGTETEMGKLPGFYGVAESLHENENKDRYFLVEGSLRCVFFGLHLNSTDGDTCFALDLKRRRFVRLSPNGALPIPLPAEPGFLTFTENRYVPIPRTSKTANCSYMEHWNTNLNKVRYAREGSAAVCYGASMYREGLTPSTVTFRQNADDRFD